MRDPPRLCREMGITGFIAFQLLVAGMLVSSLAHPWLFVFLVTAAIEAFQTNSTKDLLHWVLLVIDVCNILMSYIVFILLGRRKMTGWELRALGWRWVWLPAYWLMLSAAAWRAVWQLRSNPFFWEKTPHKPRVSVV